MRGEQLCTILSLNPGAREGMGGRGDGGTGLGATNGVNQIPGSVSVQLLIPFH